MLVQLGQGLVSKLRCQLRLTIGSQLRHEAHNLVLRDQRDQRVVKAFPCLGENVGDLTTEPSSSACGLLLLLLPISP